MNIELVINYWLPILATILSVISIILTYNNYKFNRRLETARRFNYGLEKFIQLESILIKLENIESNLKISDYYEDYKKSFDEVKEKHTTVRNNYIINWSIIVEKMNPVNIETFITLLLSEEALVLYLQNKKDKCLADLEVKIGNNN